MLMRFCYQQVTISKSTVTGVLMQILDDTKKHETKSYYTLIFVKNDVTSYANIDIKGNETRHYNYEFNCKYIISISFLSFNIKIIIF